MTDEMTIRDPKAFTGNSLPYNYLPAAFSQLAGSDTPPDKHGRIVFLLPDPDENPRAGVQYHVVPENVFGIPDALTCFLADRRFSDAILLDDVSWAPPTMLDKTEVGKPLSLNFDRLKLADADAFDQVAVIIDIGVVFWNDRFRTGTPTNPSSRFKGMRYLSFDALLSGNAPFGGLSEPEIAAYCRFFNQPGGSDIVAAQIGRQFPDCYFDPNGGGVPNALWHGTATSDLMAGLAPQYPQ